MLPDIEEFLNKIHTRAVPLLTTEDLWFGKKALEGPLGYNTYSTSLNE